GRRRGREASGMKRSRVVMLALGMSLVAGSAAAYGTWSAAPRPTETGPKQRAEEAKPAPLRALALVEPNGNATVDHDIVAYEQALAKTPDHVELWALLGRAWVRKARATVDPGYYASAGACADVALELEPHSALALELKALVALNDHRFAE